MTRSLPLPPKPLRAIALLLLTSCASAATRMPADAQEPTSFTLTAGSVSIYNLAGRAEVVSHTGSDVIVTVQPGGADGASLRVAVDVIDGRETLRVLYPDDEIHYADGSGRTRTTVRLAADGTFSENNGGFFGIGSDEVRVSTYDGDLEAWADLRILLPVGRDARIELGLGEIAAEGIDGTLRLHSRGGRVTTERTAGSLDVDTGSGSILVADANGTVSLDTGSGSVTANRIVGSRLSVDTGSGSVEGNGLIVQDLFVDTGSGRVRLEGVAATGITVDTGSGSVTLALTQPPDVLRVDTGSGRVDVAVPPALNANVSIRTGSGGIHTDIPLQVRSTRRNRLEGTFGNGGGEISIETGSGGVTIREN